MLNRFMLLVIQKVNLYHYKVATIGRPTAAISTDMFRVQLNIHVPDHASLCTPSDTA